MVFNQGHETMWTGPLLGKALAAAEPMGYARLVAKYALQVLPHHTWSFVAEKGSRRAIVQDGIAYVVYPTGPTRLSRRHRVNNNLLGNRMFCPMVRREPQREPYAPDVLRQRIAAMLRAYDETTFERAISYLYTKETLSSFAIEHERPPRNKAERFVTLLKEVPKVGALTKDVLLQLQQAIVDPPFRRSGLPPRAGLRWGSC